MDTLTVDQAGWRNAPFPDDVFAFEDVGVAVNLTGKTAAMDVRAVAGEGAALISLDMAASASADGIWFVDATSGELRIQIDQASMQAAWDAAKAAGLMKAGEAAPLVYDLLIIGPDGVAEAWIEGAFVIYPGVTLP